MINLKKQQMLAPFDETEDKNNFSDQVYIMITTSGQDSDLREEVLQNNLHEKQQIIKKQQQEIKKLKLLAGVKAAKLSGVSYDLVNFRKVMAQNKCYNVHILETSQSQKLFLNKDYIIKYLTRKMRFADKICYLFYSGHGSQKNGNWNIQTTNAQRGQSICLKQILGIWDSKKRGSAKLIIVMDSCFSGVWCQQLKGYNRKDVAIFASSAPDKTSIDKRGGCLMNCLFRKQNFVPTYNKLQKQQGNFITFKGQIFSMQYIHMVEANQNPKFLLKLATFVKFKQGDQDYEGQTVQFPNSETNGIKHTKHGYGLYRNSKSGNLYAGYWFNDKRQGKGTNIYIQNGVQKHEMGIWKAGKLIDKSNEEYYNKIDSSENKQTNSKKQAPVQKTYEISTQGYELKKLKTLKNESVEDAIKSQLCFRVKYSDGSLYIGGLLQNGNKHGFGTRIYPNGEIYHGNYKDNIRHGPGFDIGAGETATLQGLWCSGIRQGPFLKLMDNGGQRLVQYKDDLPV